MVHRITWVVVLLAVTVSCYSAGTAKDLERAAFQALEQNGAKQAADLFDRIVRDFPQSAEAPEASLRRAYLAIRLGEPDPQKLFEKTLASYPDTSKAADALRRLGYFSQSNGNLDEAQGYFLQAANHPDQTQAGQAQSLVNYAFLDISKYFKVGLPESADFAGNSLVPADRKEEAEQRLVSAREKLESVASDLGHNASTASYAAFAKAGIGETYILEQRWTEAEQVYRSAITDYSGLHPKLQALLHLGRGVALRRLGKATAARQELGEALDCARLAEQSQEQFPWISLGQVKAEAANVYALTTFCSQPPLEAAIVLTQVYQDLTSSGIPQDETREWVARVAAWRVIALGRAGKLSERNEAMKDLFQLFPGTKAANAILARESKVGQGGDQ
ncbi:MAG TPA: tetratricopeptide repeat protein [Armatimonadota bacterium]|nr:tetratricopeptide repeat protein [Armatimonadota bacterium]